MAITPPDPATGLVPLFAETGAQLADKFVHVWPAVVPFLLLRIAMGLFEWWSERRDRRGKPEQLSLF